MKRSCAALPLAPVLLSIGLLNCSHIGHRAGVEPGWNASVLYAPSYERYDPPRRRAESDESLSGYGHTDIQFDWGHGWEFKNGQRFLLQGIFFLSPPTPYFAPSVDLYWQFNSAPEYSNGGIGLILGFDGMVYALWGRDLVGSKHDVFGIGVDAGAAFAAGPSFMGQTMISFRYESLQAGLFAEYRYYTRVLEICDENCGYDSYIRSRWVGGIMLVFPQSTVN